MKSPMNTLSLFASVALLSLGFSAAWAQNTPNAPQSMSFFVTSVGSGKALSGLTASTLFGDQTMRAADHQLTMPNYLGKVVDKGGVATIEVVHAFDAAEATPAPSPLCKL